MQETFDKVFQEFEVLPAVYATRLEDFAFFSHNTVDTVAPVFSSFIIHLHQVLHVSKFVRR